MDSASCFRLLVSFNRLYVAPYAIPLTSTAIRRSSSFTSAEESFFPDMDCNSRQLSQATLSNQINDDAPSKFSRRSKEFSGVSYATTTRTRCPFEQSTFPIFGVTPVGCCSIRELSLNNLILFEIVCVGGASRIVIV